MNALMLEFSIDAMALPGVSPRILGRRGQIHAGAEAIRSGSLKFRQSRKLCGMGRVEFLFAAGRAGVPVVEATLTTLFELHCRPASVI